MTGLGYSGGSNPNLHRLHRVKAGFVVAVTRSRFETSAKRWLYALLLTGVATFCLGSVGCSSSASANSTPTPIISVALTQVPPTTMSVSGIAMVSATVSNDVANAGVDWVAICGSAPNCGSFSPAHTASGANSTFTAPAGVPSGNTVSVTAMSSTDHSKTFSAKVTVFSTVTGVTFTEAPPASYASGGSISVAATVSGDPTNAGVDWKATCGLLDCSSGFIGRHSAPGVATTFVVPIQSATYPNIVGSTIILTAYATADHNYNVSAPFTVTAPVSVAITQPPPITVLTNANVPVIATVANDPTNSGVTWTIAGCDLAPCGSWSSGSIVNSVQVASGAAATFVAPPTPVNHVVLRAAATASPSFAAAEAEISVVAPISITLTQGVVNSMIVKNASASLVATVDGDTSNAGIDWAVTCASDPCGSFSPAHTDSGGTTTFTAPSTVPSGGTVTITATSTADATKSTTQTVTVTAGVPPNSLFLGQFVLALSGKNANGGPFAMGGVIVGDGNGNITKGSLDVADLENAGNAQVRPSTYTIGSDGRGQLQLKLNTATLGGSYGVAGTVTLSIVFVTPKHALLSETDSFASGTGTLDLQNATDLAAFQSLSTGLNGIYALQLSGAETASSNPGYFLAGALTFRSSGSTYTETAYIADQSAKGAITSVPYHTITHAFANPLINPYGEMQLDSVNLGVSNLFSLNAWLIDAQHFVITDWRDSFSGSPSVIVIGYMTAQPASPVVTGAYAFNAQGQTVAPSLAVQAVGGVFTCGASGTVDVVPFLGTPVTAQAITATCSGPANGRASFTISGAGSTGVSHFSAYPTTDQGLYIVELDGGAAGTSGPSSGGVAKQQTLSAPVPASAFNGNYGSSFLLTTPLGIEGFAGQIISDGNAALSGAADLNTFVVSPPAGTASVNATLLGSFSAAGSGRFPLSFNMTAATGQPTPEIHRIDGVCYIVDGQSCLFLDIDAPAPAIGVLQLQQTGL